MWKVHTCKLARGWPGGGNGGAGKVSPELAGGVGISPWGFARVDQKSKIFLLLGSKFADQRCDKGTDETHMDGISSEDRPRGATGLTR